MSARCVLQLSILVHRPSSLSFPLQLTPLQWRLLVTPSSPLHDTHPRIPVAVLRPSPSDVRFLFVHVQRLTPESGVSKTGWRRSRTAHFSLDMRTLINFAIVLLVMVVPVGITAQSVLNPDISVIPRFRIESGDAGRSSWTAPKFMLEELEVALQGNLNPYSRADIYLAKSGDENEPMEVEEAYATILRGLPFDLNLRVGKYLKDFGKLNSIHPHVWPFVSKPASLERFLGDEGVNDVGVSANFLLPTGDLYSRWNIDVFDGGTFHAVDAASGAVAGGIGLTDTVGVSTTTGVASRITCFIPIGEFSDLEVGLSGLTGIHDPYRDLRFWYADLDLKYKWKPDSYTSWTVQGEALLNRRSVDDGAGSTKRIVTGGAYVLIDHQFEKLYTVGVRGDWSQAPYADDDRAFGGAIWAGYYPVEESLALRLQWQSTTLQSPSVARSTVNTVSLQVVFSLGPHRAHPF